MIMKRILSALFVVFPVFASGTYIFTPVFCRGTVCEADTILYRLLAGADMPCVVFRFVLTLLIASVFIIAYFFVSDGED